MGLLEAASPDEDLLGLDQAVAAAVRARVAAGMADRFDASVIVLRGLLADAGPAEAAALKAVWGRIEVAAGPALTASGGMAQILAADRYGLGVRPLSADAALKAVEGGGRALIDLSSDRPWWGRLLARPDLRIGAARPDGRGARPQAGLVSKAVSGPTGGHRSFWVPVRGV
ncbi:hypothetical protein ER13_09010, partial [Brevundimonas sp. EAKA]|uniref:hypothetical protein n=1 Tax=Brevundimonas sp. EAKA TaxID=1495854 RepID=UPI0004A92725